MDFIFLSLFALNDLSNQLLDKFELLSLGHEGYVVVLLQEGTSLPHEGATRVLVQTHLQYTTMVTD